MNALKINALLSTTENIDSKFHLYFYVISYFILAFIF